VRLTLATTPYDVDPRIGGKRRTTSTPASAANVVIANYASTDYDAEPKR